MLQRTAHSHEKPLVPFMGYCRHLGRAEQLQHLPAGDVPTLHPQPTHAGSDPETGDRGGCTCGAASGQVAPVSTTAWGEQGLSGT
jgi:hypothetical protein